MKRAFVIFVLGLLAMGRATNAHALALTPANTSCTTNINTNLSGSALRGILDGCFDVDAPSLDLLYKADVGAGDAGDSGSFASSYSTAFSNTTNDPADALISYVSGGAIGCLECYLVVKDGNHSPAQYFFDISTWNGTDPISLTGFWPQQGAISNVAIWGVATTKTPEPATLLLVGGGCAMAALRRRRRLA